MSLVTYRDARPWARAIRTQVAGREMPPWFADPTFGRPLANDAQPDRAEIDTIVAWVDAGAPEGDGASPPPPPSFVDGWRCFKNRPPDVILEMPGAFDVPADGVAAGLHVVVAESVHRGQVHRGRRAAAGSVAAVHHSDVTARALPAGHVTRPRARRGRAAARRFRAGLSRRPFVQRARPASRPADRQPLVRAQNRAGVRGFRHDATTTGCCSTCQAADFSSFRRARSSASAPATCSPGACTTRRRASRNRIAIASGCGSPHDAAHPRGGDQAHRRSAHHRGPRIRRRARRRGLSADPRICRRLADHRDYAVPGGCDPVRAVAAHALARQGHDIHRDLPGRPRGGAAARAQVRFPLAAAVPARHARAPAGGQHDQGDRPLRQLDAATKTTRAPDAPVYWSEQSWDEMFNGWMELSVDAHVIAGKPIYTLATPRQQPREPRRSAAGRRARVYVRNADGGARGLGSRSAPRRRSSSRGRSRQGQTISDRAGGHRAAAP